MGDSTHGLKDLFGSVPDGDSPSDAPGKAPAAPQPAAPAPKASSPAAPEGGHGLAGAFGGALGREPNPAPSDAPESRSPSPSAPAPQPQTPFGAAPDAATVPQSGGSQVDPVPSRPASAPTPQLDAPNLAPMPPGLTPQAPSAPVAPSLGNDLGLSCVIVARGGVVAARRTIQSLRLQTVAPRLELVVVADERAAISGDDFARVQTLIGPIDASYGGMAAMGVQAATGELVAILDDYAFPARDWAEAVLTHRHDQFAALGSALGNANPRSHLSWSNMLLELGEWREGLAGGPVQSLPPRNLVFRRERLLSLGDDLPRALESGEAAYALAADGTPLKLEDEARLSVLNPSTLGGTIRSRFAAGRLSAGRRREGMSLFKRLGKAFAAAFGAPARYRREKSRVFLGADPTVNPRLQGRAVLIGMAAEGLGRAVGYLKGPGHAARTRDRLKAQRTATLNKVDRQQFGH